MTDTIYPTDAIKQSCRGCAGMLPRRVLCSAVRCHRGAETRTVSAGKQSREPASPRRRPPYSRYQYLIWAERRVDYQCPYPIEPRRALLRFSGTAGERCGDAFLSGAPGGQCCRSDRDLPCALTAAAAAHCTHIHTHRASDRLTD